MKICETFLYIRKVLGVWWCTNKNAKAFLLGHKRSLCLFLLYSYIYTSLQLFGKIKIQTRALYCIIKATNKNYMKRDEFVSTAYYT